MCCMFGILVVRIDWTCLCFSHEVFFFFIFVDFTTNPLALLVPCVSVAFRAGYERRPPDLRWLPTEDVEQPHQVCTCFQERWQQTGDFPAPLLVRWQKSRSRATAKVLGRKQGESAHFDTNVGRHMMSAWKERERESKREKADLVAMYLCDWIIAYGYNYFLPPPPCPNFPLSPFYPFLFLVCLSFLSVSILPFKYEICRYIRWYHITCQGSFPWYGWS